MLLFGTLGDIGRLIRASGLRADNVETNPRRHQRRAIELRVSLSGLDLDWEINEAHKGTMVDNSSNERRRLVEFKDGCRYGKFGKTKAYELIAHERIRAYKMGGKTMIDLDSVDEYHASLPRVETRAT
jgi:excisionase family DNA binding protein